MFGSSRRHRPPPPPLTAATANPNAATAAASAFMRRESGGNPSLSAAAAAAALRNRPATPTVVADVETKRTRRRSLSVSSTASDARRPPIQRRGSSGSMTERSFRSPSPHSAPRMPRSSTEQVPPVPSIPKHQVEATSRGSSSGTAASRGRPASLQMQPFRVASQKAKSAQGSWFGAAATGDMSSVRTADAALEDHRRSESPSINFSYPRSPPASPPPTTRPRTADAAQRTHQRAGSEPGTKSDQPLVYDPNSRRMVKRADLMTRESTFHGLDEKPVKKKRHHVEKAGTHLSQGTMGRTIVSSQEVVPSAPSSREPERPGKQPLPRLEDVPAVAPLLLQPASVAPTQTHFSIEHAPEPAPAASSSPAYEEEPEPKVDTGGVRISDGATVLPAAERHQTVPLLGKKPSTVMEESEPEPEAQPTELGGAMITPKRVSEALDAVPVRSTTSPPPGTQPKQSSPIELPAYEGPTENDAQKLPREPKAQPDTVKQTGVRGARVHSSSPARQTHFGTATDQLVVRHSPPPRAASPRKSALKYSSSLARGTSPSDDSSEFSGTGPAVSEAVPAVRDDSGALPRKKSVRVSFDDENTVVVSQPATDEANDATTSHANSQARRPWYSSIGRHKKKDALSLDDDEIMKPRPALPSFGSVREKKLRDQEERPLVRPHDPTQSPSMPASPNLPPVDAAPVFDLMPQSLGHSSDQALGQILSQETTSRQQANTSRFREPLPPVVTSIEGSGYVSHSDSSDEEGATLESEPITESQLTAPTEIFDEEIAATEKEQNGSTLSVPEGDNSHRSELPATPVQHVSEPVPDEPTRGAGDVSSIGEEGRTIPGQFPDDSTEEEPKPPFKIPAPPAILVQRPSDSGSITPQVGQQSSANLSLLAEDSEESEGNSIYSDAYEDLSDVDEEGFMSLDAVVTTPISSKVSQRLFDKAMASPSLENASNPLEASRTSEGPAPTQLFTESLGSKAANTTADDWDKAKAYWRGLTQDKRRQLEKEALEEAGEQADLEESPAVKKKTKKRKSLEHTRAAEPQENPVEDLSTERTYQIKPGTKVPDSEDDDGQTRPTHMRRSMRSEEPGSSSARGNIIRQSLRKEQPSSLHAHGPGLRKSMRSPPPVQPAPGERGMPKTLRNNGPRPTSIGGIPKSATLDESQLAVTKTRRPMSMQAPPPAKASGDRRQKNLSLDSGPSKPSGRTEWAPPPPALKRQDSDSSASSFKRAKVRPTSLGFRRTMRTEPGASSSPVPTPPTSERGLGGRFTLRSKSPPPVSMGSRLKQTLRSDSSDGGSVHSAHRLHLPKFGRTSKKETKSVGKKRLSSRLEDSSDDDAEVPSGFASRFEDSSDEDAARPGSAKVPAVPALPSLSDKEARRVLEAAKLAAARDSEQLGSGGKDDESSDLPDSDDEAEAQSAAQRAAQTSASSAPAGLRRKRSGRGGFSDPVPSSLGTQAMSGSRLTPGHQRRSSLMSALRRKKDDGAGKISRPELMDSAARRDTRLERSPEQLTALRGQARSPRLQKRSPSWPLPPGETTEVIRQKGSEVAGEEDEEEEGERGAVVPEADEKPRPATSGGVRGSASPVLPESPSTRPSFLKRRSTSTGIFSFGGGGGNRQPDEGSETNVDGGRKKKKFGALRRMFRLDE